MAEAKVYIDKISFNDGSLFNFNQSDIVVFTGANNSGKSQVLRDIKNFFANKNATRIIATDIEPCYVGNPQTLKDECINKNGRYYLGDIDIYSTSNIDHWWGKDISSISSYFINHLTTENRLQISNPSSSFNAVDDTPHTPIQKLYIDDIKEKELSDLSHQAFGLEIILNRGAGSKIPLHIGVTPKKKLEKTVYQYRI